MLSSILELISGLGALVLNKTELALFSNHYRKVVQNLLCLKPNTPNTVCYFLAGTLPIEAIVHLRQLSILRMIMESKGNILHKHSLNALHSKPSSLSWIHQLRTLCLQYQLPHPLTLLQSSLTKPQFKAAKKHVLYYWEKKLRNEASQLPSLRYSSKSICL